MFSCPLEIHHINHLQLVFQNCGVNILGFSIECRAEIQNSNMSDSQPACLRIKRLRMQGLEFREVTAIVMGSPCAHHSAKVRPTGVELLHFSFRLLLEPSASLNPKP